MSFLFRYLRFHDIIGGIHVPVDDGVDKLNRKYTLLVFLFLALPIFTKQYIGDPIECFAPVYFAEHQSRYINSYCWTQSTYYMVPVGDPDDDGDQQEPQDRITPDELDYFISFETVTHIGNERLRRVRVNYYQWAPLILLAQGLCFYIPFLIWNSCANNAGVKLRRLLKKASDIASLPPGCQQREALLAEFVDQFHTLVMGEAGWCADLQCGGGTGTGSAVPVPIGGGGGSSGGSSAGSNSSAGGPANGAVGGRPGGRGASDDHHRSSHHHHQNQNQNQNNQNQSNSANTSAGCCLVSIPILGSLISCCLRPCSSFGLVGPSKYLCLLYLAVKFAYVFNVGLQFFLLGKFLGRGYLRHGLELINRILANGEWWASPRFPLSTLCQVRADMSGGLRSYTCQCVLPINVFNEKIFSVVWFYMAFLLPLNVLSLLFWIYRTFESNRMSYIRLCLWRTRLVELNQIHRTVRRLSQSYLGWDGVFLLRLIEHNHGSIMATLIMSRLWEFYANQIKLQEDANQIALANSAQHTLANLGGVGGVGGGGGGNSQAAITSGSHHQHSHSSQQQNNHQHQHQQQQQQQQQHAHYLTQQPHSHAGGHHAPLPPPAQQHSHAHHHHGAGGHHHHQTGGGGGHQHAHAHGAHNFPPLQPTQANFSSGGGGGAPGPPPPPPVLAGHGPGPLPVGHHSGQVSQAPGHHPLHAANTAAAAVAAAAAAHHVHQQHAAATAALAAACRNANASNSATTTANSAGGPNNFTGAHASLLAQLHHQTTTSTTPGNSQQQQQQPPGNVAAAVAALAAAAAAATSNQPGANSTTTSTTNSATTCTNSTGTTQKSTNTTSNGPIHLQSIKQQQQQQQATTTTTATPTTASATTSFITSTGPPLPPPPPAHVVAAVAAASTGPAQLGASSRPNASAAGAAAALPTTTSSTSSTTATKKFQVKMGASE